MSLVTSPASALVSPPSATFFAEPGARIMALDEPMACPGVPGLTFQAIAAAPGPRHYLVIVLDRVGLAPVVAHLGPDESTVASRGLLLVAGLRARRDIADLEQGATLLRWLADCWSVMVEEISSATAEPRTRE